MDKVKEPFTIFVVSENLQEVVVRAELSENLTAFLKEEYTLEEFEKRLEELVIEFYKEGFLPKTYDTGNFNAEKIVTEV